MTMFTDTRSNAARPVARFSLIGALSVWRQRQHLKSLDSNALSDLGLSQRDVSAEIKRPIWDVPHTWRA